MNINLLPVAETAKTEKVGAALIGGDAAEQSGDFALLLASLVGRAQIAKDESSTLDAALSGDESPPGDAEDVEASSTGSGEGAAPVAPVWLPEDLVAATPAPLLSAMMRAATANPVSNTATAEAPEVSASEVPPKEAISSATANLAETIETEANSEALSAKATSTTPQIQSVRNVEAEAAPPEVSTVATASRAVTSPQAPTVAKQEPLPEITTVPVAAKAAAAAEQVPQPTGNPTSIVVAAKVVSTEAAPVVAPVLLKSTQSVPTETVDAPETSQEVVEDAASSSPLRALPKVTSVTIEAEATPESMEEADLPLTERQHVAHTTRAFAQAALASFDPESKPASSDTLLPDPSAPRGVDGSALRTDAPQSATRETAPATSAATLASTAPADPVEVPAPEVGRFALRGVRQMLQGGEQRMTLKVLPESLGEVQIEVIRNGSDVQVRMSATTQSVREMLDAQTHTLREALAREGFDTPRIQVTLQSPSTSSNGSHWNEGASQETRQQHQQPGHGPRHGNSQPNPTGDNAPRTAAHLNGGGALNVTV